MPIWRLSNPSISWFDLYYWWGKRSYLCHILTIILYKSWLHNSHHVCCYLHLLYCNNPHFTSRFHLLSTCWNQNVNTSLKMCWNVVQRGFFSSSGSWASCVSSSCPLKLYTHDLSTPFTLSCISLVFMYTGPFWSSMAAQMVKLQWHK